MHYALDMSISEQLESAVNDVRSRVPEIEGAVIVDMDGLIIAISRDMPELTEDQIQLGGSMAIALTAGERITAELERGRFLELLVKGERGYVYLTSIGDDKILALLAKPEVKLGMLFLEAKRLSQMLEELFKVGEL